MQTFEFNESVYCCYSFTCIWLINAQTYEIGVYAGGTNNIGDVGRTNYIAPSGLAIGGIFKWNKSKRYAWRASVIYGKFTADDTKSSISSRHQRAYKMDNSILEASAGLEFNFVEYNLHKLGPAFTPYLYTGITYFRYDYKYFDAGQVQDIRSKRWFFCHSNDSGYEDKVSHSF